MATLMSVVALLETKAAALAGSPTQLDTSDYGSLQTVPVTANTTRFAIRHQYEEHLYADSNTDFDKVAIEILIHHKLATGLTERTYTEGNMHTQQLAMLKKSWWEVAGVKVVSGGPRLNLDVERNGNIMSWSVIAQIQLTTT